MKVTLRATRTVASLLLGVCALTMTLPGCAAEPAPPAETTKPATPSPEPTTAPTDLTETREPWERYVDPRFADSFELPPGWTVQENPNDYNDQGLFQFDLIDANGAPQLFFSTMVQGLGGACSPEGEVLQVEELDSAPLDLHGYVPPAAGEGQEIVAPRFVYRASQLQDRVIVSLAISNDVPLNFCMYYNLLNLDTRMVVFADRLQVDSYVPNPMPPRAFATMTEARAYMDTEEYATLKRILLSYQL